MNQNPMEFLKENNAELFKNLTSARSLAFRSGALSTKHRYLIALALDASHGAVDGVKSLAKQAMDLGATKEEIFEALEVAYYICGAGCIFPAARALNEVF